MEAKRNSSSDLLQRTINAYRSMVAGALGDPIYAARLAREEDAPSWLKEMAKELAGDVLRPPLRIMIQDCSDYPHKAKRWSQALQHGNPSGWLVEYAHMMSKRKKWAL